MSRKGNRHGCKMTMGFVVRHVASDERIREAARTKSPEQLEREAEDAARDAETAELLRRDTVDVRPLPRREP